MRRDESRTNTGQRRDDGPLIPGHGRAYRGDCQERRARRRTSRRAALTGTDTKDGDPTMTGHDDVYEPPVLAEIGGFAELTLGWPIGCGTDLIFLGPPYLC